MDSGASFNDRGLSPELYQAAHEAARRAGMSVEDWLTATFGKAAVASASQSAASAAARRSEAEAEPAAGRGGERLSETVAKLNARLEQLTTSLDSRPPGAAAPEPQRAPPPAPDEPGIDQVIAEIAARQRALEQAPLAPAAASPAPVSAFAASEPTHARHEAATGVDLSGLEKQLGQIAAQIETLRRPCGVEDVVKSLRADLADVARAVGDAQPRRALEGLQADMRVLAERIEHGYGRGANPSALEGIEQRLVEVQDRLNAMTPAEAFAGFDQRISELAHKVDAIGQNAGTDPELVRYLEAAIHELRDLSQGVASAEGVAALAGDVQALGERIDHIAAATGAAGIDTLAQRVNELTHALDSRVEQIGPLPTNLQSLVQSLTDKLNHTDGSASRDQAALAQLEQRIVGLAAKLDRGDASSFDRAALTQLEERIMGLADRIETAGLHSTDLSALEHGIRELTMQVHEAREEAVTNAERVARAVVADIPRGGDDQVRRDLETLQAHQVQSDQRTQDTLEAVHDTLERLVERMAGVETGLRATPARTAELARGAEPMRASEPPREFAMPLRAPEPAAPVAMPSPPAPPPAPPARAATPFVHVQRVERPPIAPDLPADTPLEPGIGAARGRSPAERIAASEAALGPALGPLKREGEVAGKANFIAAARRAAQAAANEGGGMIEPPRPEEARPEETPTSLIGRFLANRRRALVLGVSALLLAYGAVQVMGMLSAERQGDAPRAPGQSLATEPRKLAAPPPAAPQTEPAAAPDAANRQSAAQPLIAPTPTASLIAPAPVAQVPAEVTKPLPEITGSVGAPLNIAPAAAKPEAAPAAPAALSADKLPAAIAGPALRVALAAGNPAAEYEIGVRYSEGRGVAVDLELAVQWFERAASHGLAPAQYRVGSLYEKGLGVKKDLNKARTLYLLAADKGNAKAIHNLAVLYAEGIDGKPDYAAAAQWFRRAATRGVADSQYNLGILYARGIGVDPNLAESYKWFALAAAQGDQDAGKKRDDVAGRLDQQALVAARLAVQTFTPDTPPDEAMNVKAPPGGWDKASAAAPTTPVKPTDRRKRQPS
jgi:localization factor PodJL